MPRSSRRLRPGAPSSATSARRCAGSCTPMVEELVALGEATARLVGAAAQDPALIARAPRRSPAFPSPLCARSTPRSISSAMPSIRAPVPCCGRAVARSTAWRSRAWRPSGTRRQAGATRPRLSGQGHRRFDPARRRPPVGARRGHAGRGDQDRSPQSLPADLAVPRDRPPGRPSHRLDRLGRGGDRARHSPATPSCAAMWTPWASEIAADVFAFLHTGYASIAALYDVVGDAADDPSLAVGDPHPVGWLRTALGCEFCRPLLRRDRPVDLLSGRWRRIFPSPRGPTLRPC